MDQPFDWWSSKGGPMGLVDAVTPPDPSSHYTTTNGDDKTTIPNTGIIGNTDNRNSVELSTGVCDIAVHTRASLCLYGNPSWLPETTYCFSTTATLTQVCVI